VALLGGGSPAPLGVKRGGNELILSWTANPSGFTLQSTPQLTPPAWVDVPHVSLLGGQWTVTNSFSSGHKFYRLRKP
jgi:hypothetical protein